MQQHRHEAVHQDHLDTAEMITPETHEVCERNEKDSTDVVPMQPIELHELHLRYNFRADL
jgi:hypothetical protein